MEDKLNMYNFLKYFASVIPCMMCRNDFKNYLESKLQKKEESSAFKDKISLIHFLIDAHNYVNIKLGKRVYSYEEVNELYIGKFKPVKCALIIILLVILVSFLCFLMWKQKVYRKNTDKFTMLKLNE